MKNIFYLLSLLAIFSAIQANTWLNPHNEEVYTIYYQGMNNSQTQASKYTGRRGFISPTTNEHIICSKSIDIVKEPRLEPDIDEIVPAPVSRKWKDLVLQPRALVANLWQLSHESIARISHYLNGIQVVRNEKSSVTQTMAAHSLLLSKINIAQEGDLANHAKKVEAFNKKFPQAKSIFMGVSRGAGTTFQAAVRYNKENKEYLNGVQLIVLEGCFDSVLHAAAIRYPWLFKYETVFNKVEQVLRKVIAFKKDGPSPIKEVQNYPKDIPVVFITSSIDTAVPARCTKTLVKELVKSGHEQVYLLELKNSRHPCYMSDDEKDLTNYQNFMHAIYKKYNLPHIPEYAQAGKDLVDAAKVDAQSLKL